MVYAKVVEVSREKFPRTEGKTFKYGTAGFRDKAEGMDHIMFRMGLLAVLRSQLKQAAIGVMITASHNPACDNGIKLIDPMGEMLALEWEGLATCLANVPDDEISKVLESIVVEYGIDSAAKATVFVGRDTRPSSAKFQDAVQQGVNTLGGEVKDFGVVSTPVLHFVVTCHNDGGQYGEPTMEGYLEKLSNSFTKLRKSGCTNGSYEPIVIFDGANGVGAPMMAKLLPHLKSCLKVEIFNSGEGELNHCCGTDYVKSNQIPPTGVPKISSRRIVSVDGDADRVLYSYFDDHGLFHILDGDKIATLVAAYIKHLLEKSGIDLKIGLVQTAYANGASTAYVKDKLGVEVVCVSTGVKHLHHAALQFDVGVYFEANGHGTVVFSKNAKNVIRKCAEGGNSDAEELLAIVSIINETVGDALSDMLLVETVLLKRGWSCKEWNEAYTDFPNKLTKVTVADRSVIRTTDAERVCTSPEGLQDTINALVAKYKKGRSFVRPSGTEDIVRVYAEAASVDEVNMLSYEVASAVYDQAGGKGPRPVQ